MKSTIRRYWPEITLSAILIAHLLGNIVWLNLDKTPLPFDPANHTLISLEIRDCIKEKLFTTSYGWQHCMAVSPFYSPLIHTIISIPFLVIQENMFLLRLSNTFLFLFTILMTYIFTSNYYMDKKIGLSTALIFSLLPIMYKESRFLWQEIGLIGIYLLNLWLLLRSKNFTVKRYTILTFVVTGLGTLGKLNFIIYMIFPYILEYCKSLKTNGVIKTLILGILGMLTAVTVVLPWVGINFEAVIYYLGVFSIPEPGEPQTILSIENFLFYFSWIFRFLITPLLFTISILMLIKSVFAKTFSKHAYLVGTILTVYLLFTLLGNKDPRYVYPIIPLILGITMYELLITKNTIGSVVGKVTLALILTLLATQYFVYSFAIKAPVVRFSKEIPLIGWVDWISTTSQYFPAEPYNNNQRWPIQEVITDLNVISKNENKDLNILLFVEWNQFNNRNLELEKTLQKATGIYINTDFPIKQFGTLDTDEKRLSYINSHDYIVLSEQEWAKDNYYFKQYFDPLLELLWTVGDKQWEVYKTYTYSPEPIDLILETAYNPSQTHTRYNKCTGHTCDHIYLLRKRSSYVSVEPKEYLLNTASNLPTDCQKDICKLQLTVPSNGWVEIYGPTFEDRVNYEYWYYDASKDQLALWVYENKTNTDISISIDVANKANYVKTYKGKENNIWVIKDVQKSMKIGLSELKADGNCSGRGCKTFGYAVLSCNESSKCSIEYKYNPLDANNNETQMLLPMHTTILQ